MGNDQTEGLVFIVGHEAADVLRIMRPGRVANAARIKSSDLLERKDLGGLDVDFSGQTNPVAQGLEVMRHCGYVGAAGRVVPGAAVAHGIQSAV